MKACQLAVCVVVVFAVSACNAVRTDQPIEASSFVVRDSSGKARGVFGPISVHGRAVYGFELFDERGASRVAVAVSDEPSGGPALVSLRDANGREVVALACGGDGLAALQLGDQAAGGEILLKSENSGVTIRLQASELNDPANAKPREATVSIVDSEGRTVLLGKEAWAGAPLGYFILQEADVPGLYSRASLSVDAMGRARLELIDDKPVTAAVLERRGSQFGLQLTDAAGVVVAELPLLPISK